MPFIKTIMILISVSLLIQDKGSVVAASSFDAQADSEKLRKAMKGLGEKDTTLSTLFLNNSCITILGPLIFRFRKVQIPFGKNMNSVSGTKNSVSCFFN